MMSRWFKPSLVREIRIAASRYEMQTSVSTRNSIGSLIHNKKYRADSGTAEQIHVPSEPKSSEDIWSALLMVTLQQGNQRSPEAI
mmetsp:Transcript_13383/g.20756  ORF Transcript_13383/g.20756 Transcript_13383/m.20756 type:complete len:85 (-) Transcript_13383:230-484(-)